MSMDAASCLIAISHISMESSIIVCVYFFEIFQGHSTQYGHMTSLRNLLKLLMT